MVTMKAAAKSTPTTAAYWKHPHTYVTMMNAKQATMSTTIAIGPETPFSPIARLRPSRTSSATAAASRNPHRYPPVGPINMPIPPRMPENIGKPIAPSAR